MLRIVNEAERIIDGAEGPASLASDGAFALVQAPADDHERRQGGYGTVSICYGTVSRPCHIPAFGPRDDRAETGPHAARSRAAAEIDAADGAAGQADRPGNAVIVRAGMQGANDRDAVGPVGNLRKQLADARPRHPRRHRRKGPAILHWRVRLRVPGIKLRRPAPEPQEDNGARGARLKTGLRCLEVEQICKRQAEHRRAADLQEFAAADASAGALSGLSEQ